MTTSIIVVDGFLQDPHGFRKAVLNLSYPELSEKKGYPGRNSAQRIQIPGLEEEISRLAGTKLKAKIDAGHARARITLEGDQGTANIHIDPGYWSGILYLSLPEHCDGGTDFYRHKETGTERALLEPHDIATLGVSSTEEANEKFNKILLSDTHDMSKWERIMRVPMRFNRLLLLRPWFWHTASAGFGDSLENGRLVYLLFFDEY